MKEVRDWNDEPRMMWVWDDTYNVKYKRKVIFIDTKHAACMYPVTAVSEDGKSIQQFSHCAEIESCRRMTYKQLSRWLRKGKTREFKDANYVYSYLSYKEDRCNEEVPEYIKIRENDGEWREPLIEG